MNNFTRQTSPRKKLPGRNRLMAVAGGFVCLTFAAAFSTPALAQSTVVIGGNGKSSVEVNLGVLEPSGSLSAYGRELKMPGMKESGSINLRMPGNSRSSGGSTAAVTIKTPKLNLKRPAKPRLSITKRAPALPPARITKAPAPKIARVTPPPQKAVPTVRAAVPKVPAATTRPAPKPVNKPVAIARTAPAVTPPPPPPAPPAPKMTAPKTAAPKLMAPKPVAPKPMVRKPAPRVVQPAPVVPAMPKVPAPVVAAAPAPAPKQVASLPPNINISTPGLAMQVGFSGSSTRISADEKARLNAFADRISASGDRLQLKSFAGRSGETPSAARRRSLSRALAVRSYLIEKGIRSTRIDVRALGMAADQGPTDRVDVIILVR